MHDEERKERATPKMAWTLQSSQARLGNVSSRPEQTWVLCLRYEGVVDQEFWPSLLWRGDGVCMASLDDDDQ